jgi:hypothetical protein
MKYAFVVLIFAWAGAWAGVTVRAQGQPGLAYYTGDNDVPQPPGVAPRLPEDFVGGVQRDQSDTLVHHITVVARPSEEKCGRSFYIKGTFRFDHDLDPDADISGTMVRCTNSVLLGPPCNERKNYQVQFKGTITRVRGERAGSRRLSVDITYFPDEKWIRENCKKARVDRGTDAFVLTEAKPDVRSPTSKIIYDDIDEAERLLIDNLMKGMRQPR